MSDESGTEAPVEEASQPQVRLAENESSDTFVIPDLGSLAIGHQWHLVDAEQLAAIQVAAGQCGILLEVKEG